MTTFEIYLLTRLDAIHGLFTFFIIASAMTVFLSFLIHLMTGGEVPTLKNKKIITAVIIMFFIGCLGVTLSPTTKEAAVIYLIPKISQNENVHNIPDKMAELLKLKLDQWITDSMEKKDK